MPHQSYTRDVIRDCIVILGNTRVAQLNAIHNVDDIILAPADAYPYQHG